MKVIIVGGVAGGASAATRLRRLNEKAEIVIIERSGYVSYANCGLPYYIGGFIEDEEELTLQTPESFSSRFNIDVRVKQEVTDIDSDNKVVTITDLNSGNIYEESYNKLILSPGAKPVKPNLKGIEDERIFTLRTVEETFKIKNFVDAQKPQKAVVIGGGFIGLEVAENLSDLGINVTLIHRSQHVLNILDYDMAMLVHSKLMSKGINLLLNANVSAFESDKKSLNVLLKDDGKIKADLVIMSVGVLPESTLAEKAGLKRGIKNAIMVNDKMETSVKDIYAVGDAVMVKHKITGTDAVISLAGPANKQGRIVADNICGLDSHYKGSMGSSVLKLFDMTIATTGITEKVAKNSKIDYDKVVLSPSSHAGYYPNAKVMTMKVIFEKATLKILGAQIIGTEGVDKRIDVIATAIQSGINAVDLKDLDLAYAPPYSSAKDPVNMAGFMIENIVTKKVKQFHYDEIESLVDNKEVTLLDVRTPFEFKMVHIDNFINIPVDDLRNRIAEIDKSKPVYVMCQSGLRSYIACRILTLNGYDCYNFSGGYGFYKAITSNKPKAEKSYPCGMDK